MNPEQWQKKRGHARTRSVPIAITVAEIAHRVEDTALTVGSAKPVANVGGQVQVAGSAVKVRHRQP